MRTCPNCGREFERIGQHWSSATCGYPDISDELHEVSVGLLLGDGAIAHSDGHNPGIQVKMINRDYLKHLLELFGPLGCDVRKANTAQESFEQVRDSLGTDAGTSENYSDVYYWQTRRHPGFRRYEDWYSSGSKVFPDNIDITPRILNHWYSCDGHYHNCRSDSIVIYTSNEIENKDKLRDIFSDIPVDVKFSTKQIRFSNEDSEWLWEYMGEPLPGFGYKWPERFK